MKNVCFFCKLSLLIFLLGFAATSISAYSLRQFSSKNGLSNSAILSICQDNSGLIWMGSCDGLNIFDGSNLRLYKPANMKNNLSGNLIGNMMEAEENVLWIQTNYGLDRFDTRRQTMQSFKEFKDVNKMTKSADNDVYIIKDDGCLYYFRQGGHEFRKLNVEKIPFENVQQIVVDSYNVLWIFASGGNSRSYVIEKSPDHIKLIPKNYFNHSEGVLWGSAEGDIFYFIDGTYALYEYDMRNHKKYYVADMEAEIRRRGDVSSIIKQQNDYFIGFKSSGLIQLKYLPDQKVKYTIQSIDIQSGIFCLVKDKFQDIIWVGTDGQGVYMYFTDTFSIRNTLLDTPDYQVNNPVRALYLDDEQTLWIGTKGDGILRMLNYHPEAGTLSGVQRFVTDNSALTDNSVYCFASSRWKRLWIGTETGMNYYSYKEKKLKEFPVVADGKMLKYVHSITELNDSTLWVATVGEGIVKIILDLSSGLPHVKYAKRITLDDGKRASNYFFVSFQENDSIIWFGNRGYGACRMNAETEAMKPYRFDQGIRSHTVNDIFAILKNDEGYWFGTSFGLTRFHQGNYRVYNEVDGFPNNTIHGILEDRDHNLWLSTNQGLVKFNIHANTVQIYRQQNALEVIEFSDGAYFKDERSGTLFFGGINGFITINENNFRMKEYMPVLQFNRLSIFGKENNIHDFMQGGAAQQILKLDYSQNFFSLSFVAIDYINGNNYTYSYKIDGLSNDWVENGLSTTATFSNLAPGQYRLLVKYRSNITGKESEPQVLTICITPPLYLSNLAYWIYSILILVFVTLCVYMMITKYRRKRDALIEEMNRKQREELYESKLRFFTNITHEFCTPLTLIYGPCEKILSYSHIDGYVRKYATMIQQNTRRLNALILELIEFRRLETGHKALEIRELSVSEQTRNIAESFDELAESRGVSYQLKIEAGERWNSDAGCLSKIVNNLISNAFKYTPDHGTVIIEQRVEKEWLCIRISNSGRGIEKEDLTKIFDRYTILDNFEVQNPNGISPRNGLGLAICHSMVNLLDGKIRVMSVPNEMTTFEVILPVLPLTSSDTDEQVLKEPTLSLNEKPVELKNTSVAYDSSKLTVMIIDDDPSMLWFVSEIFVYKYNVLSFGDAEEALEQLNVKQPDLIISDVMMPGLDGMSFAKRIKSNKQLCHIPLILLSALNGMDEQVKGIESGAEAYITKPFNVEYLEKIVDRLIQREEDLKEYYSSVFSSFELEDGRFLHKDDKSFFDKMMKIIDENVLNPEFSIELLSSSLGCSMRQFYRKLKNITDKTPADIIKEYRLTMAERLLLTTSYSVEEVMYKVGFVNCGTFYKLFSQKYGMTPRQYRESKKKDFEEGKQKIDS